MVESIEKLQFEFSLAVVLPSAARDEGENTLDVCHIISL